MKKYVFIGIGGFLGAVSRYLVKEISIVGGSTGFPVNTLIINITGSFVLALILTVALEVWQLDESIRLGITTGFLGAYTTFSTMCKETVMLFQDGRIWMPVLYVFTSVILGLAAVYFGVVLGKAFVSKTTDFDRCNKDDAV